MKYLFVITALLIAGVASAQEPGMTPEMQQMMQNMQKNLGKVQQCLAQVDHKALDHMQDQAKKMEAEIRQLCAAGKRDEAQNKAIEYGREMSRDPEIRKLRQCGEGMKGVEGMHFPGEEFSRPDKDGGPPKNICDIGD